LLAIAVTLGITISLIQFSTSVYSLHYTVLYADFYCLLSQ